jgi:ABC-type transport system involved in multi-copper enzyme maturation permease subunit
LKLGLGIWKEKLKGKDKFETAENYSILGIFLGAMVLSSGFLVSIISPKGLAAILLMFGSMLSFISTVALILVWLTRELLE